MAQFQHLNQSQVSQTKQMPHIRQIGSWIFKERQIHYMTVRVLRRNVRIGLA